MLSFARWSGEPRRTAEHEVADQAGDDDVVWRVVDDQRDGECGQEREEQWPALAQGEGDESGDPAEDDEPDNPAGDRAFRGELDAAAKVFCQPDRAVLERVRHVARAAHGECHGQDHGDRGAADRQSPVEAELERAQDEEGD